MPASFLNVLCLMQLTSGCALLHRLGKAGAGVVGTISPAYHVLGFLGIWFPTAVDLLTAFSVIITTGDTHTTAWLLNGPLAVIPPALTMAVVAAVVVSFRQLATPEPTPDRKNTARVAMDADVALRLMFCRCAHWGLAGLAIGCGVGTAWFTTVALETTSGPFGFLLGLYAAGTAGASIAVGVAAPSRFVPGTPDNAADNLYGRYFTRTNRTTTI